MQLYKTVIKMVDRMKKIGTFISKNVTFILNNYLPFPAMIHLLFSFVEWSVTEPWLGATLPFHSHIHFVHPPTLTSVKTPEHEGG